MRKKIFLFLIIFVSLIIGFTVLAVAEPRALEIDYPKIGGFEPTTVQKTLLPDYIKYLFNFSLIIVGLIVFASLVIGGFLYLVSAGNPTALSDARDRISGAVIGLVLLLSSWLILNTINPQLTILYPIELSEISIFQGQPNSATIFTDSCSTLIGRPCTIPSECDNGKKCLDIFANGNRKCVDEDSMISFPKIEDLLTVRFGLIYSWDDRANSIILYGNDYEIRVCAKGGLKECKIIKNPTADPARCVDIDSLGIGDNKLSSFEVMTIPRGARLYEDKNFGGDYQDFEAGPLGVECYQEYQLGNLYNNASSIEINPAVASATNLGYWVVVCDLLRGGCGNPTENIITPNWVASDSEKNIPNDTTSYGDPNLSNNYIGNDRVNKICVINDSKGCGGVLVLGGGVSDFIKRGEQFQFGKKEDTIVPNNSVEGLYQWHGNCKVKIWEKAGTGYQGDNIIEPYKDCGNDVCCGRVWEYGPLIENATLSFNQTKADDLSSGNHSCYVPPAPESFCDEANCSEYVYTFNKTSTSVSLSLCPSNTDPSECLCPFYDTRSDCSFPLSYPVGCTVETCNYCSICSACNPLNNIFRKASCILVTQ